MEKVFDLAGRAPREGGETVLGLKDLGTHACYMLYGVLTPGDEPRLLKPGAGHEEIICCISGAMVISGPDGQATLQAGQALYLKGDEVRHAEAMGPGEARYLAAGGHSPSEHHHHH